MKVFAIVVVAAVFVQLAIAAPSRSCGCKADSDEKRSHRLDHDDLVMIQRAKQGGGFKKPSRDSSEEDCGCGKGGSKWSSEESRGSSSSSEESDEKPSRPSRPSHGKDDCYKVEKPKRIETSRCTQNEKIYLHRQAPIYVRPPPSKIFINHPAVVVRQPPVILHHQSRSPVLVKPILIKEREVAPRPVLFKISKPDTKVSVSKCEKPTVHVSACERGCAGPCSCERKEKSKPCH